MTRRVLVPLLLVAAMAVTIAAEPGGHSGNIPPIQGAPHVPTPSREPVTAESRGALSSRPADPCASARHSNHWCRAGSIGFVAGVPIKSRFLFDVLDAHGHTIVKSAVACPVCLRALETDGFCPDHKMGYFHGKAYMSPITWHLARARSINPAKITCAVCREHNRGIGWCDKDRIGIAGDFAVADREEFRGLEEAYRILVSANDMSARCERCAGAMIADGYCAIHKVKYAAGKATEGSPPAGAEAAAP